MTEHDSEQVLRQLLADAIPPEERHFANGFAERVVQRIAAERATPDVASSMERVLSRQTRRLLPALIAASLALTAWNWWSVRDTADSPLAAALGLQPVTLAAAVGSGVWLGAEAYQ